jgi:ABC-type uncharacterized transport system permease subunit
MTTVGMVAMTLLAGVATAAAFMRLRGRPTTKAVERAATVTIMLMSVALLIYHAVVIHKTWAPLEAHVDGLLLLIALLAIVTIYLQFVGRLRGVDLFLLPTTAMLCAWGICASWWSYQEFTGAALAWNTLHLISVYLGAAAVAAAAAAGALFLYVQHQLKRRDNPAEAFRRLGNLTNLESLDRTIVRSATVGFLLLTVAMITGFVSGHGGAKGGSPTSNPWFDAKVIGSMVAWLIMGLVAHVRFAPTFRGRRAAQLSLIGFVVLLVVMALAVAMPGCSSPQTSGQVRIGSDSGVGVHVEARP